MTKFAFLRYICFTVASLSAMFVMSCSSGSDEPEPGQETTDRTVLVYMVADNSLGSGSNAADVLNLRQMEAAASSGALGNGRLLVFRDGYGSTENPALLEITPKGRVILKEYDENDSSVDADFMTRVLDDAAALAPAPSNWLVLWSHGTGWIETSSSRSALPQSFGQDVTPTTREMKVTSLARALGSGRYEVVYFDCCFMGCIEVMYELRHAAGELVASATELPVEGMPYDINIPAMFSKDASAEILARNTLDYYLNDPRASNRSCTIAVVKTSALDNLAAATRAIMQTGILPPHDYQPVPMFRRGGAKSYTYDFGDYVRGLGADAALMNNWNNAYSSAVTYYGSTPVSYTLDMSRFTGLGSHFVATPHDAGILGYKNQSWWKDVVSHNPSLAV